MFILPSKITGLLFFSFFSCWKQKRKNRGKKYGQCHFFDTFCGSIPVNLFLFNIALHWGKFNIDSTRSGNQISAVLASSNYTKITKYYLPYGNPKVCPHPAVETPTTWWEEPSTPGKNPLGTARWQHHWQHHPEIKIPSKVFRVKKPTNLGLPKQGWNRKNDSSH